MLRLIASLNVVLLSSCPIAQQSANQEQEHGAGGGGGGY
jgi:hypothetical protein